MALRSFRERLSKRLVFTVFGLLVLSLLYWGLGSTRWTTRPSTASTGHPWVSPERLHQLTNRLLQEQHGLDPMLARRQAQQMLEARSDLAHNLGVLGMATSSDVVAASLKRWQQMSGLTWDTWHHRLNIGLQRQGRSWSSWLADWVQQLEWATFANAWSQDDPAPWPLASAPSTYHVRVEWFERSQHQLVQEADSSPAALHRFYKQHRHVFTTPARVRFSVVLLHAPQPFDTAERQRLEAASYDNADDVEGLARFVSGKILTSPWFSVKEHRPLEAGTSKLPELALQRISAYLAQHPEAMQTISDPLYLDAQTVLWFQQRDVRQPEPLPFKRVQSQLKRQLALANLAAQTKATLTDLNQGSRHQHPGIQTVRWTRQPSTPWAKGAWQAFFTQPPHQLPTTWRAVSDLRKHRVVFYRVVSLEDASSNVLPPVQRLIGQLYRRRLVELVLAYQHR